jgi:hypothetical protein
MNKNKNRVSFIKKTIINLVTSLACVSFLILVFGSLPVKAQSNDTQTNSGELISFKACAPQVTSGAGSNSKGAEVLIKCIQQVSIILLIFGIILGGIMTAKDTLQGYIPGQEVNSAKNLRDRIRNLIIGVILISLPGAILSLVNPAATGLDFLSGLEGLRKASGIPSGGGGGGGGGKVSSSGSSNVVTLSDECQGSRDAAIADNKKEFSCDNGKKYTINDKGDVVDNGGSNGVTLSDECQGSRDAAIADNKKEFSCDNGKKYTINDKGDVVDNGGSNGVTLSDECQGSRDAAIADNKKEFSCDNGKKYTINDKGDVAVDNGSNNNKVSTLKVLQAYATTPTVSATATGKNSCRTMYFKGENSQKQSALYQFDACADKSLANYYVRFNDCLRSTSAGPNLLQFEMIVGNSCKFDPSIKNSV